MLIVNWKKGFAEKFSLLVGHFRHIRNGIILIVGDYKYTLKPQLIVVKYTIPKTEELLYKVRNAYVLRKLIVADAFMGLICSEKSCELMAHNTLTYGLIQSMAWLPSIV